MLKVLLFILVPVLILGGLGYFRFVGSNNLAAPQSINLPKSTPEEPIEVPKTLPQASLEDRVKSLENLTNKLVTEVNKLKSPAPSQTTNPQINPLDASVTELKMRVSALEKATPTPQTTTTSSAVYIPLGSGGGPWSNTDWYSMSEYEISLESANYPNYTGMVLEVTFRLLEAAGTGYIRLYNVTDSSATSSELSTTSSSFSLKTSSSFKLASGTKTYKLQVKSSQNKDLFVQSARIKVTF